MNIKQATEFVASHCSKTGDLPSHVVPSLWRKLSLGSKSIMRLAQEGLRERVRHMRTAHGMGPAKTIDVEIGSQPSPQFEPISITVLEARMFVVPGGTRQLLHFRIQDFRYCINNHKFQLAGLLRRTEALKFGEQLLVNRGVSEVSKLSKKDQEAFAEKWQEAEATYEDESTEKQETRKKPTRVGRRSAKAA